MPARFIEEGAESADALLAEPVVGDFEAFNELVTLNSFEKCFHVFIRHSVVIQIDLGYRILSKAAEHIGKRIYLLRVHLIVFQGQILVVLKLLYFVEYWQGHDLLELAEVEVFAHGALMFSREQDQLL